jgi:hypothetical protein
MVLYAASDSYFFDYARISDSHQANCSSNIFMVLDAANAIMANNNFSEQRDGVLIKKW